MVACGNVISGEHMHTLQLKPFFNEYLFDLLSSMIPNGRVVRSKVVVSFFKRCRGQIKQLCNLWIYHLNFLVICRLFFIISLNKQQVKKGTPVIYSAVFTFLNNAGILPLALYRPADLYDNKLPYVYTNPAWDTDLNLEDKIFVLAPLGERLQVAPPASPASKGKDPDPLY